MNVFVLMESTDDSAPQPIQVFVDKTKADLALEACLDVAGDDDFFRYWLEEVVLTQ